MDSFSSARRELLRFGGMGLAAAAATSAPYALALPKSYSNTPPLVFDVRNGESTRPELLMHFPYPPARWWDNPYCPCGNILFFTGESKVEEWCARHRRPQGVLLDMRKAIGLADRWFGDYASPEWRRKTPDQALAIFEELELDPEFWTLQAGFR